MNTYSVLAQFERTGDKGTQRPSEAQTVTGELAAVNAVSAALRDGAQLVTVERGAAAA